MTITKIREIKLGNTTKVNTKHGTAKILGLPVE